MLSSSSTIIAIDPGYDRCGVAIVSQTGVKPTNNSQINQIYKDLAWSGLEETPIYKNLPATDKDRIQSRRWVESHNTPRGSTQTQGKPCK